MINLVVFKRDLRIYDHAPLRAAMTDNIPVLGVYLFEPEYWKLPDVSANHFSFICDSLKELSRSLHEIGVPFEVHTSEALPFLRLLHKRLGINAVFSHEETGNAWTFARDKSVRALLKDEGIKYIEFPTGGVIRGLTNRNNWQQLHKERINAPNVQTVKRTKISEKPLNLPSRDQLGLSSPSIKVQRGGRRCAVELIKSFKRERIKNYQKAMSSPITAEIFCSRLSSHLAYGTVSIKEIYQSVSKDINLPWSAKNAFISRLCWHCHFIQKLESAPEIEFENMHKGFDQLDRIQSKGDNKFLAWKEGKTGYPLVDACMRYLKLHGWINFRMRAMLVSFACYDLWLDWRLIAPFLAQQFTDYEPGIHYSQIQMQAGTTGINIPRIYCPTKQAKDQDPKGEFIRKYVPELSQVSDMYIHMPWLMTEEIASQANLKLGKTYPLPIVDHRKAVQEARRRIAIVRSSPDFKNKAHEIYQRLGSRKRKRSHS